MADTYHTLGYRFAESLFLAKTYTFHPAEHFLPGFSPYIPININHYLLDEHLAELMETLRVQMNAVLRFTLPVQKRSRLVRNYWDIELLVKEIRLLLDPVVFSADEMSHAVMKHVAMNHAAVNEPGSVSSSQASDQASAVKSP